MSKKSLHIYARFDDIYLFSIQYKHILTNFMCTASEGKQKNRENLDGGQINLKTSIYFSLVNQVLLKM